MNFPPPPHSSRPTPGPGFGFAALALAAGAFLWTALPSSAQRGATRDEVVRVRSLAEAAQRLGPDFDLSALRSRPLAPGTPVARSAYSGRPRILVTGYWPPTNEMLRRFSTNVELNPLGWIGSNWEDRGYDVFSFFPEFDPPNCGRCGKGTGDLEVDYQDTSADGKAIVDTLQPVAVITFSRGFSDMSWEVELNQYNRLNWIPDYQAPFNPTQLPPDPTIEADALRLSALPLDEIVQAIDTSGLGLEAYIDLVEDGGAFLSEFAAYHGVWHQAQFASPNSPRWAVAGGHVHVGGQIPWPVAEEAAKITIRAVLEYVEGIIDMDICQRNVGHGGPGPAVLQICGDSLGTGGRAEIFLRNARANATAWIIGGPQKRPRPYRGGTLVPAPGDVVGTLITDRQGRARFKGLKGGGGPAKQYLQALYEDPDAPDGLGFSTAVEVELLP